MQELRYYIKCDRCPAHEEFGVDLLALFSRQHQGPVHRWQHNWYKADDNGDDLCEECWFAKPLPLTDDIRVTYLY